MLCWPRFTSDSVLDGSTINSSWWLLMVLMPKGWICSSRQNIKRCVDDFYLSLLRQTFFFFLLKMRLFAFLARFVTSVSQPTVSTHKLTYFIQFLPGTYKKFPETLILVLLLLPFLVYCYLPAFITESKLDLCRIYMFLVSFHSWFYAAQSGALLHLQLILMEKIILH